MSVTRDVMNKIAAEDPGKLAAVAGCPADGFTQKAWRQHLWKTSGGEGDVDAAAAAEAAATAAALQHKGADPSPDPAPVLRHKSLNEILFGVCDPDQEPAVGQKAAPTPVPEPRRSVDEILFGIRS